MSNALHLVLGAMVIAPGFEPISRVALGLVNRSPTWKSGLSDMLKGYAALIVGAILMTFILQALDYTPDATKSTYLPAGVLLSYWTSISATSLFASIAAATAGAFLILQERSVLTAGVMIALALVPSATICGLGIANADLALATTGLYRFAIETLIVSVMSIAVFAWKFRWMPERKTT